MGPSDVETSDRLVYGCAYGRNDWYPQGVIRWEAIDGTAASGKSTWSVRHNVHLGLLELAAKLYPIAVREGVPRNAIEGKMLYGGYPPMIRVGRDPLPATFYQYPWQMGVDGLVKKV